MDTVIALICPVTLLQEYVFLSVKKYYGQQRPYNEETGAFSLLLRWCEALKKAELDPRAAL